MVMPFAAGHQVGGVSLEPAARPVAAAGLRIRDSESAW